jgi:hypothetical protein
MKPLTPALSMNRSAGLQPAYDSHPVCGIQLKEKISLGADAQSRSQTGAPVAFMAEWRNYKLQLV